MYDRYDATRLYHEDDSNFKKTCPNCGAAIESDKCAYCGTTFIDFACMDLDKPFFMKIKHNGEIKIVKVIGLSYDMHIEDNCTTLYADNDPVYAMRSPDITFSMDFNVIPMDEKGTYAVKYAKEFK